MTEAANKTTPKDSVNWVLIRTHCGRISPGAREASAPEGVNQYIEVKGQFSRYDQDPYAEPLTRAPVTRRSTL